MLTKNFPEVQMTVQQFEAMLKDGAYVATFQDNSFPVSSSCMMVTEAGDKVLADRKGKFEGQGVERVNVSTFRPRPDAQVVRAPIQSNLG